MSFDSWLWSCLSSCGHFRTGQSLLARYDASSALQCQSYPKATFSLIPFSSSRLIVALLVFQNSLGMYLPVAR
jgi:hypothetical protein